jgi:formylglycine-generating enzyme required for sulfatase activity
VASGSSLIDADLVSSETATPWFLPDVTKGEYLVQLIVNDGSADSDPDTVIVTITNVPSNMAEIPSGCFDMGDAFDEGLPDELPVHKVCITGFYMDNHEVTNAEYKSCVDDGACTAPSSTTSFTRATYYGNATYDNYPVIFVNSTQADTFCSWAGKRLPTEAEWEYAARGGLSGKRFPWGDSISCALANWNGETGCVGDTSAVESYPANGYGLYDMTGNVLERVNDWYSGGYYSISPISNPQGPATGTNKVMRGGSWRNYVGVDWYLRVADRSYGSPNASADSIGFRCARD